MASRVASAGFRGQYETVVSVAQEMLGFDMTILVNAFLILGAVSAFLHYMGGATYRWASQVYVSQVHINEDDALYEQVMRWMMDNHLGSKRFRSVKATSPNKSTWEDEDEAVGETTAELDVERLISYRGAISRVPINMAPFESRDVFRHNGHWIFFAHKLHRASMLESMMNPRERGYITLRCLGRSLAPVRALLEEAQLSALNRSMSTTNIWRGLSGTHGMRERMVWVKVVSRPSRDIRTVILERAKKHALLADINEYLHPRTRRWYSNHGIPYRRGYLFSGAPGTGKTSLTAAIAGVFGLDIYVLSLLDPALTEAQLMRLLAEVPSRCIVLLEDVDAAGLNRPGAAPLPTTTETKRRGAKAEPSGASDALAQATGQAPSKPAAEISLSGLLNAIDGVSSHEGRILVMTTNNPESLDKALVRPGRVDMHIAFELPRRAEMRELFLSMYRDIDVQLLKPSSPQNGSAGRGIGPDEKTAASTGVSVANGDVKLRKGAAAGAGDGSRMISDLYFEASDELSELADRFAAVIPEGTLSLASIQGYMLRHKRDPRQAVENAEEWGRRAVEDA